jgi:hypothetical protein
MEGCVPRHRTLVDVAGRRSCVSGDMQIGVEDDTQVVGGRSEFSAVSPIGAPVLSLGSKAELSKLVSSGMV